MTRPMYYILDDHGEPVPVDPDGRGDALIWARWFENGDKRRVALTEFPDGSYVSTVFLGIDHNFYGGPPILYETMAFGPDQDDDYQMRYETREEALLGHEAIVLLVKAERGIA